MRRFILLRVEDVSGSSGTGRVGEGVVFSTGWAMVCFCPPGEEVPTYKMFPGGIEQVERIHGHGNRTRIHFQDKE